MMFVWTEWHTYIGMKVYLLSPWVWMWMLLLTYFFSQRHWWNGMEAIYFSLASLYYSAFQSVPTMLNWSISTIVQVSHRLKYIKMTVMTSVFRWAMKFFRIKKFLYTNWPKNRKKVFHWQTPCKIFAVFEIIGENNQKWPKWCWGVKF